jgi:sigma-B regulation protein RsbU (phosphoserine phosphatase)
MECRMETPRILIADDQPHILEALQLLLKNEGFAPEAVSSPAAVMQAVQERNFDVLLLDLNYARDTTSGLEGLELLSRIRKHDSSLPVVLMTAWGSIELAVEAMHGGGGDFVQKPWDNQKLLNSLRRQIDEGRMQREKKRELEDAHDLQQGFLPTQMPTIPGCEIQVFWKPAKEVGGDYVDAIGLSGSESGLCIADVAGKGLPAALLMANMQASVRGLAPAKKRPAEMCCELNRVALKNSTCDRFTTLFYGILDSTKGSLRYSNAGHVPPILVRADGTVVRLTEGGMVLGVFRESEYEEAEVTFGAGDRLVLVTDGIIEARNIHDEEFGEDRLIDFVREFRHLNADELRQKLLDVVEAFARQPLQDDATLMIVARI